MKEHVGLGRQPRRAVFAAIFCVALGVGLWSGARVAKARAQQGRIDVREANQVPTTVSPFYCNTKSLSIGEWAHKMGISQKMRDARVEIKELPNGYAFRYDPSRVSPVELADWVSSEARCCPFFDMTVRVEPEGGPLWLTLTGQEGVKRFIQSEFKLEE